MAAWRWANTRCTIRRTKLRNWLLAQERAAKNFDYFIGVRLQSPKMLQSLR